MTLYLLWMNHFYICEEYWRDLAVFWEPYNGRAWWSISGAQRSDCHLFAIFCFACVCVLLITGSSTNELSDLLLFP